MPIVTNEAGRFTSYEFPEEETTLEGNRIVCLRADLQNIKDDLKTLPPSRELSLAITKIDEARMWLDAIFLPAKAVAPADENG